MRSVAADLGSASRGLLKYEHTFVVVKVCCHAN
jgi:hypothetical protein